jgi:hypothetical protein
MANEFDTDCGRSPISGQGSINHRLFHKAAPGAPFLLWTWGALVEGRSHSDTWGAGAAVWRWTPAPPSTPPGRRRRGRGAPARSTRSGRSDSATARRAAPAWRSSPPVARERQQPGGVGLVAPAAAGPTPSKPPSASGWQNSASAPARPAIGTGTGRRVIASRSARPAIRTTPGSSFAGTGASHCAKPSVNGTDATTAAMRVSAAAVVSAWPPPKRHSPHSDTLRVHNGSPMGVLVHRLVVAVFGSYPCRHDRDGVSRDAR